MIAGDFNTNEITHALIMSNMVRKRICNSSWKAFRQIHGQHGDMGFVAGMRGNALLTKVTGHDPKHCPYAFKWMHKPCVLQQAIPADSENIVPVPAPAARRHWECYRYGDWINAAAEPTVTQHHNAQEITEYRQKQVAAEAGDQPASSSFLQRNSLSASTLEPAMPKELRTNLVEESESAESKSAAAEHRNAHEDIGHDCINAFPTSAKTMIQPANAPTSHVAAAEPTVTEHHNAQEITEYRQKQLAAEAGDQPAS